VIAFERSRKGFKAERDLFATQVHLGFFTILITQEPIIDRLFRMLRVHYLMKMGSAEMAGFADEEPEPTPDARKNAKVRNPVPHHNGNSRKGRT
jgi:hypothetical protein